jgi:hypothetical protein
VPAPAAARRTAARLLPQGPVDVLRQVVLFCGAYWLYRLARGLVDGRAAEAFANARQVVDFERSLGLFPEPAMHHFAEANELVGDFASWMYVNSHFVVTTITLAYIYLRRNERFYFVRNMFMVAMGIALVLYVVFPTAPPRFMPELGFRDSVAEFTGVDAEESDVLFNPYAAIPSMHVCFALMLGLPMAQMVRRRWATLAWRAYPVLVTWVVIATANHWWFDAALGAGVAAAAYAAAVSLLGRARPEAWARDRAPVTAGA